KTIAYESTEVGCQPVTELQFHLGHDRKLIACVAAHVRRFREDPSGEQSRRGKNAGGVNEIVVAIDSQGFVGGTKSDLGHNVGGHPAPIPADPRSNLSPVELVACAEVINTRLDNRVAEAIINN